MSFLRKIFSKIKVEKLQEEQTIKNKSDINLDPLIDLVKPIIRKATQIEVQSSNEKPKNSHLLSHFGGNPYFKEEEIWPENKSGKPLSFIFQLFNNPDINLPKEIN